MSSLLKRAIIASVVEHPDAEVYRRAAFVENPGQLVNDLTSGQTLTKADFAEQDDKGKAFIDSQGGWRNFDKVAALVLLGGEKFTYEDFTTPKLPGLRTLLDSATLYGGTSKIFTFDLWKGRFDEMEKLWYKIPTYERSKINPPEGLVPLALKRQLLEVEGKQAPEDRLASVGLSFSDIRNAVAYESSFENVNRRLQQAGDWFRKDYVLMVDAAGDSLFNRSFARFDAILKGMQAHGEYLDVKDYLRQLSNSQSLLARAGENNALDKVFAPAQWVDRLPDMLTLWSNVKDGWKRPPMTTQNFDNAYAEAEGQTYAKRFKLTPANGKASLLTPLNADPNEKPVLPLGLKVFWDKFDAVKANLEKNGECLTTADLRACSGQMGDSCLISAAKFGCFDKVIEIAEQSEQPLTMADFLSKDAHGTMLIHILAEKGQLSKVFTVENWTGHLADMRELWSHVSAAQRRQIDFQKLETGVKQATLKKKAEGGPRIRPQ